MSNFDDDLVYLKCVKEGPKLRIKIISPGFFNQANCQFPKDIRVENRKYSVPRHAVSFSGGPNHKFFYKINKSYITILTDEPIIYKEQMYSVEHIFEDETTTECIICMNIDKEIVFASCGHYACCESCSMTIFTTTKKCPICRNAIYAIVKRDAIQI